MTCISIVLPFCLSGHFNLRRPSAGKVQRLIGKEGWTTNSPKAEEVVRLWKPPTKQMVETDPYVGRCVSEQTWTGLALKDFGPPKGLGKKTFQLILMSDNIKYYCKVYILLQLLTTSIIINSY